MAEVRTARATIAWLRLPFGVPDPEDPDRGIDPRRRRNRERRIGRDEHLGVARLDRKLLGQGKRVAEVAAADRRPDRLDRLPDPAQIARAGGHDPGGPTGLDHADLAAARQVLERLDGGGLGGCQAIRWDIGRGHARRGVDDQHEVAGQARRSLQEWPRGQEGEDCDQEELKQEQEASTELLPRGIGLDVRGQPLPE